MPFFTADICDEHKEDIQVLSHKYKSYGGVEKCEGNILTLRLNRENSDLIEMLKEDGKGQIIVVDVDEEFYAVVGENLMKLAQKNNWRGILINGFVRDTQITKTIPVGLWALGTCARKSHDKSGGERNIELNFGGVCFKNGDHLLADHDGIIVTHKEVL
jgi:regulator of ribonuclease activity A